MFITNTVKKNLLFIVLALFCAAGCEKNAIDSARSARKAADASRISYEQSVSEYKRLIARGKDIQQLNYELGMLYYNHGDYQSSIQYLKVSNHAQADKYLAICLYKSADFTEALNIFKRIKGHDSQSRYFYGLTTEKLNLFDEALKNYRDVRDEPLKTASQERIKIITQENAGLSIEGLPKDIQDILRNAPPEKNYPDAGALILSVDEKFKVSEQNTAIFYQHYMIKILNDRGKEDFSEMVIDYDSTDERIELEYARTIKPDGTVIQVGTRHIRDVSKYMNFPLYSNARAMIISFPEVTQGAVIEYKLKIYQNELINKKDFVIPYTVQEKEPIIRARFLLDVPQETNISYKTLNENYNYYGARLDPKVTKNDRNIEYLWEFNDIPQVISEPNMPPFAEISPLIIISTFKSWQEIYNWWWALAKDKIKIDSAIKNKVAQLTSQESTLEGKIKAVYNFCAQDIRYVAVEYGRAGYEPHSASDIFSNKYGDCKDQAILLVTMLREIGAEAYPVLIPTKESINLRKDFPSMLFNHCIAMVRVEGKDVFMDPTASTCSFDDLPGADQDRNVLIFTNDAYKIERTPLYDTLHNTLIQKLHIDINPDESISARREVYSYGQYDQMQRAWLTFTPPQLISQGLEEKIQGFALGACLIKYDMENVLELNKPVTLKYSFSGQEYWTRAGHLRILPQLTDIDNSIAGMKKRRYPIDLGLPEIRISEYQITLPSKVKIKYLPAGILKDSPWLNIKVEYSQKGAILTVRQETSTKNKIIMPEEYAEFKKFLEDLSRQIKQRTVLELKK